MIKTNYIICGVIRALLLVFLASTAFAASGGLTGDCVDCHTMHNSVNGAPVAIVDGEVSAEPIQNLLKLETGLHCMSCQRPGR
jgi:hypothetical protein